MRIRLALMAAPLLALAAPQLAAGQTAAQLRTAPAPAEISIVDEGPRGVVYRQSSDSLRLYTYDKDPPGRSACDQACASAWPPVYAPPTATPVGDWSVVSRADGKRQWALKGKPVYTHFHDAPGQATGEAAPGWRLLPYAR